MPRSIVDIGHSSSSAQDTEERTAITVTLQTTLDLGPPDHTEQFTLGRFNGKTGPGPYIHNARTLGKDDFIVFTLTPNPLLAQNLDKNMQRRARKDKDSMLTHVNLDQVIVVGEVEDPNPIRSTPSFTMGAWRCRTITSTTSPRLGQIAGSSYSPRR